MSKVVGVSDSLVLISNDSKGVVIDKDFNLVVETGDVRKLLSSRKWNNTNEEFSQSLLDLASGALANLEIKVITASGRLYTIPKGVQAEAKKSLEWRKEYKRGGTPVGLNTARTLARGGQIGIEKVRHIAKYFPRHEVDKKAEGWEPGEKGFPSRGRIAWALWGGDAGWRWAKAIVERENKKALTSDGYAMPGYEPDFEEYRLASQYQSDMDAFKEARALDPDSGPEFVARVRLDGSGIDRLYKIESDGSVFVWDDTGWDSLGHVNGDVYSYDSALDDPEDSVEKDHIVIDTDSAIIISARLQQMPFTPVSIEDIDSDEALLMAESMGDVDWSVVDYAIAAAGTDTGNPAPPTDGQYTPKERSINASRQVRDASGRFASQGSRVVVGGDTQNGVGYIRSINPSNQTVSVQLDSGKMVDVPANTTEKASNYIPSMVYDTADVPPLDVSGILGQPRVPIDRPNAKIPGTLPALTANDLQNVLYNWPTWVKQQRDGYVPLPTKAASSTSPSSGSNLTSTPSASAPTTGSQPTDGKTPFDRAKVNITDSTRRLLEMTGAKITLDPYKQDKASAAWLNKKVVDKSGNVTYPNRLYYQPVTSPSVPKMVKPSTVPGVTSAGTPLAEVTPETSDVPPLYIAIVSPDDPRAVLDLVSIVPAGEKLNSPMTFKRVGGKWVKDEGILADLNSATPPPVVPLDGDTYFNVLEQVDGIAPTEGEEDKSKTEQQPQQQVAASAGITLDHILNVLWGPRNDIFAMNLDYLDDDEMAIAAAGGVDRNRGNAERLRRYWVHGKGAAKIRWGAPGDWKRCVRHLAKYLGPRAKGYCQLRHKEALGIYTSTHAKRLRGRRNSVTGQFTYEILDSDSVVLTKVTPEDMKMPVEDINNEPDDLYDDKWTPDDDIIVILVEAKDDDALLAAGGLDRNRGQAEKLRRYWLYGKGAAKIRWNTPGDWTRCVRHLAKYMGPRAKGYCALRHKEATGLWTGDRMHRQIYGNKGGRGTFSNEVLSSTDQVIEFASLNARTKDAKARVTMTASAELSGAKFSIPLVIPENMESGDGRKFEKGAIELRELPLPLMWQIKTADGHMGSVVVGRIDHMERVDSGIGNATGVFDTGEFGQEAERLVREGFIRGVSADMDKFEAQEETTGAETDDEGKVASSKLNITKARVMGVTIVPKPAFQECKIFIVDDEDTNTEQEDSVIPDGVYVEDVDPAEAAALVACGFVAGAIPVVPPKDWFTNPQLDKPTPLTVTDEGKVYGHIAAWHVDHIGMAFGTRPPKSKSKYAYFHTGVVRTDDGADVPVGQLTLAGGHAPLEASAVDAARHYDDTASAVADVHAGEDAFGIWVAGALRPGATPEQIRALRASAPSGDWRPIKGSLELVAVCQVNVPGFPIARARVASGQIMALVAAGASTLARMKSDPVAELAARIDKLEQLEKADLVKKASELSSRFEEVRIARREQLTAKMAELSSRVRTDEFDDNFGYIPRIERMKLAKKGKALPDGSFPISNEDDLRNAISSYGRAKEGKKAAVRRHIMKRARQLDKADMIPDEWKSMSTEDLEFTVNDLRSRIPSVTASAEATIETNEFSDFADISDKARQRLAKEGKALPDGSYPIRNVGDLKNAIKAYGRSNPKDRAKVRTHIRKRARALGKEELIPENWKAASTMEVDSLGKASAAEFGKITKVEAGKYMPGQTQPRDAQGKFRQVLARLKQDLGDSGLQDVVEKVQKTENLDNAGNYIEAARSATELISIVDRIDTKALNPVALENVRNSARQLGETIANLPLPFGNQAEKVRYSDLPPALKNLVEDMIKRVEDKIGQKDADVATKKIRDYMAGGDLFNQSEISSELSKMLRLLT